MIAVSRQRSEARGVRAAATVLSLLWLTGCAPTGPEVATEAAAPIAVRITMVRQGSISGVRIVTGQTAALSVVRLASPVAGRVTLLSVRPGDHLERDATVARVLPSENEAAVQGFGILAGGNALNADDRALGQRVVRQLQGRDIALRAPFPAIVSARLRNPGERVSPNDIVVELFDPTSLYVVAQIPVDAARDVRPGLVVDITRGSTHADGVVEALVPAVDAPALTVPIRIALTTALDPPLLAAAVECRITVARHDDVLIIPRSAVVTSQVADAGSVVVVAGGESHRRPVALGLRTDKDVEVTSGLVLGEAVAVDGAYAIPDGSAVRPATEDP